MNKKQLEEYWNKTHKLLNGAYSEIQSFFDDFGAKLAKSGVSANFMSIIGFVIGLLAINFISMQMYATGLLCVLINRGFDALDGAIARKTKITHFGVFLDAVLDCVFFAGVIFAFALANPMDNAVAASFMLFAFIAATAALLVYGLIAGKLNQDTQSLKKAPVYLGGMTQWSETTIAIVLMCVIPSAFMVLAIFFGIVSLVKAMTIVAAAYYNFVIANSKKGKNE